MKKKPELDRAPGLSAALRRYLYITAGTTGAAVMIVEILGAKMLAPYVGTSHFVWTAQIAVTLLALASGYAAGGWLADRSPRPTWIYWGLIVAAVWLAGAVMGCEQVAYCCLRFKLALGSLLASAILFFVPLALTAMVGPFFVRVLTSSVLSVGKNVGRLTAIGTLGSVAGTVLIGYVLIPRLPNSVTMCVTAGLLLAVAGAYFVVWERTQRPPALTSATVATLLVFLASLQRPFGEVRGLTELFRRNSNFGLLQVVQNEAGSRRSYLNDLLTQNNYDPRTGQSVALFTHMLRGLARAYTADLRDALCIGLGVGIVPMQLARDGVRVEVVEINPAVVPLAQRFFDFQPQQVRLHFGDGRWFLNATTNRYDAIVLDAFLGESPPAHLMTQEAFRAMEHCLKPGGVLVINTFGEMEAGRDFFTASLMKTLREVFRSVCLHDGGNGNVFFVASDQAELRVLHPPDYAAMPTEMQWQAQQAFDGRREPDPTHGRVLRDDFNPVDFYDAANREELRRRLALSYRPE